MADEAQLSDAGSGLSPETDGWFVVNAADAAWARNEAFGARCAFERGPRVLTDHPELEPQRFTQMGCALTVLTPGRPTGLYHTESEQEDFLVLQGSCTVIIDDQERVLRRWDLVHCPPGTRHCFVATDEGPCILLMVGARSPDTALQYPDSELARSHGAGAAHATDSFQEAYASVDAPPWRAGRPDGWDGLPWS